MGLGLVMVSLTLTTSLGIVRPDPISFLSLAYFFFFGILLLYCPLAAAPTPLCIAYLGPGLAHIRSSEVR